MQDDAVRSSDALARLDELRRRGVELTERLRLLRTGRPSTTGDLRRAQAAGRAAVAHSRVADLRRDQALLRSAAAHDRAAAAHDRAVRCRSGDSSQHTAAAVGHRTAARADRLLAAHPRPPSPGAG